MKTFARIAMSVIILTVTLTVVVRAQKSLANRVEHSGNISTIAQVGPLRGTVNVFLANQNGLVVVTDSRLSNGMRAVDRGQKLFQIDDHTVCSIAGWYSAAGPLIKPDISGNPSYPAYLAVSDIIQTTISSIFEDSSTLSIERKMKLLSNIIAFSLLISASIYDANGITQSKDQLEMRSEVTIAGYNDKGILEILQTDLIPNIQNGKIVEYNAKEYPAVYITKSTGFISVIRGIPDTANSILGGYFPAMYSADNYAFLGFFKNAIDKGEGNSLSLLDLELFAREIERHTALKNPELVGDDQQIAILENGKVSFYHQPFSSKPTIPSSVFRNSADYMRIDGAGKGLLGVHFPEVALIKKRGFLKRMATLGQYLLLSNKFLSC